MTRIEWPDLPFPIEHHLVLAARRGSEAHGTYVPPDEPTGIDDRDIYGVLIPPARYYMGLERWEHAESIKGPWDVVLDEIGKYVRLLTRQNPNVLQTLWLREEDYLVVSPLAERILSERLVFRAKMPAFHAFVGYARGQFAKMGRTRFRGYMGDKRKRLVEKFGYDSKNAAHMIRLLAMGKEYLETGELRVFRTDDRDTLLAIKRGDWPMEKVMGHAASLFDECQQALERSPLPEAIDVSKVEEILTGILRDHFGLAASAL